MQSYAIICNHMQSEAIRGNQRQSEAIRGNQRRTMLCSCSRLTASQSASTAPVCSSCPRTNATSCLSNALSFWSQRRDSQWESARQSDAIRGNQMPSAAISGNQRLLLTERQSAAISINQRSCASIRGSYMQSEAIRGHQRPSACHPGSSHWVRRGTRREARARRRPPWAPRHAARRVRCT